MLNCLTEAKVFISKESKQVGTSMGRGAGGGQERAPRREGSVLSWGALQAGDHHRIPGGGFRSPAVGSWLCLSEQRARHRGLGCPSYKMGVLRVPLPGAVRTERPEKAWPHPRPRRSCPVQGPPPGTPGTPDMSGSSPARVSEPWPRPPCGPALALMVTSHLALAGASHRAEGRGTLRFRVGHRLNSASQGPLSRGLFHGPSPPCSPWGPLCFTAPPGRSLTSSGSHCPHPGQHVEFRLPLTSQQHETSRLRLFNKRQSLHPQTVSAPGAGVSRQEIGHGKRWAPGVGARRLSGCLWLRP